MTQTENTLPVRENLTDTSRIRVVNGGNSQSISATSFASTITPYLQSLGFQVEGQESQISNNLRVLDIYSNFSLDDGFDVYLTFSTGTPIVCSLPKVETFFNSSTRASREFTFKLMSEVGGLTLTAQTGEFIDGEPTIQITEQYKTIKLVPSGTYYWVIVS